MTITRTAQLSRGRGCADLAAALPEFLQMKFYFDSGLGDFDILEGNIPAAWLAQGPSKRMCTRPWK